MGWTFDPHSWSLVAVTLVCHESPEVGCVLWIGRGRSSPVAFLKETCARASATVHFRAVLTV